MWKKNTSTEKNESYQNPASQYFAASCLPGNFGLQKQEPQGIILGPWYTKKAQVLLKDKQEKKKAKVFSYNYKEQQGEFASLVWYIRMFPSGTDLWKGGYIEFTLSFRDDQSEA